MTIEELMYYGRYYSFEYEQYHLWWFDLQNTVVYPFDELVHEFGYSSQEEVLSSGYFIPLFKTDIVQLEHEFLSEYSPKHLEELKKQSNENFDTKFKMFIEKNDLVRSWHDFEYNRLYRDAVKWCNNNKIKAFIVN